MAHRLFSSRLAAAIATTAAILAAMAIVLGYIYDASRTALLQEKRGEVRRSAHYVVQQVDAILGPVRAIVAQALDIGDSDLTKPEFLNAFQAIATATVKTQKRISGAYAGLPDGSFYMSTELRPDTLRTLGITEVPDNAILRRVIDRSTPETSDQWLYQDALSRTWTRSRAAPRDYDPRTRPWYRAALEANRAIWTDPYIFAAAGELGITYATPVRNRRGELLAVVGIDFTLADLAAVAREQARAISGTAFVASDTGRLIAHPALSAYLSAVRGEPRSREEIVTVLGLAAQLGLPGDLALFKEVQGESEAHSIDGEGRRQIGIRMPLSRESGLDYAVYVGIPEEIAIGKAVDDLKRNILILAGLLAALAIAVGYMAKLRTEILLRRRTEAAMTAISGQLNIAIEHMPGGIAMVDHEGRLQTFNRAYAESYGLPSLAKGTPIRDVIAFRVRRGDYGPGDVDALVERQLARYQALEPRLLEDKMPGDRIFEISRSPTPDGGLVAVFNDVTERKAADLELRQAKEAAEEATKAKSSFLAMMSHEIRTPMNGVMSMAEMLDQTELTADQRSMSAVIRGSAAALLTIINDILDFSKIEAGKLDIERVPFSLLEVVESVGELIAPRAEDKTLSLVIDVDPELPDALMGDPTRLRQVLLNLAGNAIKFTDSGSVAIRVSAAGWSSGEGDEVSRIFRFEVTDTGIGLTPEQRARLFQAFAQADASTARKYGGTGLGLSISQRLCELMGGSIGVASEFGQGSTFWFELPFVVTDDTLDVPDIGIADARIACIGFEPAWRAGLDRLFDAAGIVDVAWIGTDDDALALLQSRYSDTSRDDIVLLRMTSAHGGAAETARAILADRALPARALGDCKVILVAPRALASTLDAADRQGFFAAATLPLRRHRLWHMIAAALGRASLESRQTVSDADSTGWAPPDLTEAGLFGAVILAAEDNPTNQIVLRRLLSQRGYAVEMADNGALALAAYRPGVHGLVLTDFHMPEMDGFELTRRLRARETDGVRVPIVALTADALPGTEQQCLEAGMDGYLTKPIDSKALAAALERWLPQAKALRRRPAETPPPAEPAATATTGFPGIDPQVLDVARLSETFGGINPDALAFLGDFVAEIPQLIETIVTTLAAGDAAAARDAAHALKGAGWSAGAQRLGQIAADIQDCADAADLETASMLGGLLAQTHAELAAAADLLSSRQR
jgi:signal transduction histidine kinase/CheY-like chemotaxis protein/HPt (histidine-containing phosphotransfer) domain-containing protein